MTATTELQAGRELDALVAEKVMGFNVEKVSRQQGECLKDGVWIPYLYETWELRRNGEPIMVHGPLSHGYYPCPVPDYSTDIAAAWEVVEKCQTIVPEHLHQFGLDFVYHRYGSYWRATLRNATSAEADTAPLAICRAALKAVGA